MKIKRFTSLTLSSFFLISGLSISSEKASAQASEVTCAIALADAFSVIENDRNVNVVDLRSYELAGTYRNYPRETPHAVLYVLEGRATEDILVSGQFMTILATRITTACPSIGLVEFGLNHSSWREALGKVNGQMTFFTCIPPGTAQPPPQWGEQVCP